MSEAYECPLCNDGVVCWGPGESVMGIAGEQWQREFACSECGMRPTDTAHLTPASKDAREVAQYALWATKHQ